MYQQLPQLAFMYLRLFKSQEKGEKKNSNLPTTTLRGKKNQFVFFFLNMQLSIAKLLLKLLFSRLIIMKKKNKENNSNNL